MEITVFKNVLNKNLKLASVSALAESSMKLCECVLLNANSNGLSLCCNNLETSVKTAFFDANVSEGGLCAVNAKMFGSLISGMPEADIKIRCDEKNRLTLESGKLRFDIGSFDAADFPQAPDTFKNENCASIKLKTSGLKDVIRRTVFSAAQDSGKPIFKGELFETENEFLNLVTIDGYRISFGRIKADINRAGAAEIKEVIPADALKELLKILPEGENDIEIHFLNNQAFFQTDGFVFSSRLIEGEFFNYKQNFAAEFPIKAELSADALLDGAERALILAAGDFKKQPFVLEFKENNLHIQCASDYGQMDDVVPCDVTGGEIKTAYNPKYLSEAVKAAGSGKLQILMSTPLSAGIIQENADANYRYLILPIKI